VRVGGVFKLGGGNSVSCRMLMLVCESNGVYVGARIKRCVIASVASPVCMGMSHCMGKSHILQCTYLFSQFSFVRSFVSLTCL